MIALPCQMFSVLTLQLCERTENQHFGRSLFLVVLLLSPAWLDLIFSVALSPAVDNRSCSWEAYLWHRQGGKERNSQQQQINGFAVVTLEISVFPMRSQWTGVKRASRQQRLAVGCAVSSTAHMHTKRGTHYIQQLNGLRKMTKRTLTRGSFVSRDRVTFLRRY